MSDVVSIEKLMEVIERDIVNPYMYTILKSIYSGETFEIMFSKKEGWQIRNKEEEEWTGFRIETALNKLNDRKLDVLSFHKDVYEKVIMKALYHRINYESLEELLGKEELDRANEGMQEFKNSLKTILGTLLDDDEKQEEKPKFKVITDE